MFPASCVLSFPVTNLKTFHFLKAHLLNVFDNTKSVKFHEKDYDRILAVISCEGEKVDVSSKTLLQIIVSFSTDLNI